MPRGALKSSIEIVWPVKLSCQTCEDLLSGMRACVAEAEAARREVNGCDTGTEESSKAGKAWHAAFAKWEELHAELVVHRGGEPY